MNLKFYRKKNGYNQTQIANYLGICQQNVSLLEKEKIQLTADTIIKLCRLYQITPNELIGYQPDGSLINLK